MAERDSLCRSIKRKLIAKVKAADMKRERDEARAEVERLRRDNEYLRHSLRLISDGSQHAASIALVALKPPPVSHSSQSAEKGHINQTGGE